MAATGFIPETGSRGGGRHAQPRITASQLARE
jgi:hypothetical protein